MADYPTDYYYGVVIKQPNVAALFTAYNVSQNQTVFKYAFSVVNVFYRETSYRAITTSASLSFFDTIGIIG
jgi:hypothetical protein